MTTSGISICGVTESMLENVAAWQRRTILWTSQGWSSQVFQQAFDSWSAVCGLTFREANQGEKPDILVTRGKIDGTFKVLAWSELPDGSDRQLTQKYDSDEPWIVSDSPPSGKIDLLAVACHEIGHALGLEHAPSHTGDLMEPTYAPGRRTPQPGDVARILSLYGPPTKPDDTDFPAEIWIVGRSGKITSKFKLERIG